MSYSQSFPCQSSGTCSHLLFLLGCSLLISHLHSWDRKDPGKKRGCFALAQKPAAQLWDSWEVRTTRHVEAVSAFELQKLKG